MELKDVILSTLAEMEVVDEVKTSETSTLKEKPDDRQSEKQIEIEDVTIEKRVTTQKVVSSVDSEMLYLSSIKERLLVLFEGFQAPNNTDIEAKVDMTLNFLEYTLATIDSRITLLEKGEK